MKCISTSIWVAIVAFMGSVIVPTLSAADSARLHFDNQCITIDGKDYVIFSGAFHYFRCPKELWADRFRKLKEAGFNTLETYSAWNWHEQTPPANPDDYSKLDMTDLNDWLAMATDQFGFNIILRPGPYICAEWDGGGYPQWLITKRPADFQGRGWLRGDDATYLAWCKHWYTAVAKVAAPYQITHQPAGKRGIILWQIENEYNYSDQPIEVKRNQLLFLAHASRDLGIDVPLTTCMTSNNVFNDDEYLKQNVVETRNTYPKFNMGNMQRDIGMLDNYQPDKFKMVTELQGGWFSQVGGQLSEAQGFDAPNINHVTLFAWEHGFTVTNYYMGFGGTNLGDWAAATITTSYDYDAPLRECGGITERYLAVKALGNFIAEHGTNLARTTLEKVDVTNSANNVITTVRRAADGSRYVFVRTEERKGTVKGNIAFATSDPKSVQITANYELGPFGAKVLYLPPNATTGADGQWYPKVVDAPKRPTDLPSPVRITEAKMQPDPGPRQWTRTESGQSEESAGIFNRGFVFYRTVVPKIPSATGERTVLSVTPGGKDWAGFTLNGQPMHPDEKRGSYTLTPSDTGAELIGLYENFGRANGGAEMEKLGGLTNQKICETFGKPKALNEWRMKRITSLKRPPEMLPETDDSTWSVAVVDRDEGELAARENAVYRTTITVTEDDLKNGEAITLGRVDDEGTVQVNGKVAGECRDWSVAQRFEIGPLLHPGKNLIAVLVRNRNGSGGLGRGAWIESSGPALPSQWEVSDQSGGVAGKWWNADLNDSSWKAVKLGAATSSSPALLTWYRMKFDLPAANPHQWVPWKLHLDVIGNGFLYLNGHALGRWWQVGPQRDFYLPECWLNSGPGNANVVTLSLRPTEGVGVRSAEVQPYANMAEVR